MATPVCAPAFVRGALCGEVGHPAPTDTHTFII